MQVAPLQPGNRVELPAEWVKALGLRGLVALEKTPEGILVRPCAQTSCDEFFATGLEFGSAHPVADEGDFEVTRDDYLF